MSVNDYIASLQRVEGTTLRVEESVAEPQVVLNPASLAVEVAAGSS